MMGTQFESDYGNNIEGIPLPGDMPQIESSAVPNREDSNTLLNPDGDTNIKFAQDYFDDEEAELGGEGAPFVESKDNEQSLVEDEENSGAFSFSEMDKDWDEGVFPETQPLHVEGNVDEQQDEELTYVELQPDNIQHGPE
jgi:hypothetical protein